MVGTMERFTGIAGLGTQWTYFQPPAWVDKSKVPGTTSLHASKYGQLGWWRYYVTGAVLFYSANLQWLVIASIVYMVAPYDLSVPEEHDFAPQWLWRFALNAGVVLSYHGIWHVGLFWCGWSDRPLKAERVYKWSKVAHNAWYSLLAVVMYTTLEAIIVRCWATHRLPYTSVALDSFSGVSHIFAVAMLVPIWRDFHFYFSHRLIHLKPLYRHVHNVHHHNTDVEPFAGLCMHPVEHLLYFGSASVFLCASPFAFLWNGYHCMLAPIGGHSGFEIHFSQSQLHYLHHRFFECNYGSFVVPFDKWFGTFRDKLSESTKSDTHADASDAKAKLGWPSSEFAIYAGIVAACWVQVPMSAVGYSAASPLSVSSLVVLGPLLAAVFLTLATAKRAQRALGLRKLLLAPFDKQGPLAMILHLVGAAAISILPAYQLVFAYLSPPGQSLACKLWGCA